MGLAWLAWVGHIRLALGRIRRAFVGHKRLPYIQLVEALGHILVLAYMGQQLGHRLGQAYSLMVVEHRLVDIHRRQVLVLVLVEVEEVGPFHWHCLLLPLQLVVVHLVLVVVLGVEVGVVRGCQQHHYRSSHLG